MSGAARNHRELAIFSLLLDFVFFVCYFLIVDTFAKQGLTRVSIYVDSDFCIWRRG